MLDLTGGVIVNKTAEVVGMVYAFIVHTLFPGPCRILFYQIYGTDGKEQADNISEKDDDADTPSRKQKVEFVASQVHSEYQFRRTVANRTVESDMQAISQDDQLPEFELGFLRQAPCDVFNKERITVWMGAGNTGFALVCDKEENRVLAETVLKLLVRYLQEYLRVLHQPAEASLKAERVCLILSKFLPEGSLVFMNHRVVRGLEKELEIAMK